jgi:anti-sigma factor RsiW
LISLTAVPAPGEQTLSAEPVHTSDGYNIYRWSENGMTYWAISDLAAGDLGTFVQLFRAATREP